MRHLGSLGASVAEVNYRARMGPSDTLYATDLWNRGSRNAAATLDDLRAYLDWPDDDVPERAPQRRHRHGEWGSDYPTALSPEELLELDPGYDADRRARAAEVRAERRELERVLAEA